MKYDASLYGGRPASLVLADERTIMRLIRSFYQCMLLLAALFLCAIAGCAEPVRVYTEGGVVMHENDLSPCEKGANGCYVNGQIYYTTFDVQAKDHEILHSRGMRHAAWKTEGQYVCAIVTAQGNTEWTAGSKMCRNSRGEFLRG